MLFERFEIGAVTGEMAGMNGVTGTVTDIYWDSETAEPEYRYAVRLDVRQPTHALTHSLSRFLAGRPDRSCTVPCGVVFARARPPPNSKQCLVCAEASRYTYPSPKECDGPLLPYCSPACLALHKERHELEALIIAGQDALSVQSLTQAFGGLDLTDSVIMQYKQRIRAGLSKKCK